MKGLLSVIIMFGFWCQSHSQIIDSIAIQMDVTLSGSNNPGYVFVSPFALGALPNHPNCMQMLDANGKPVFFYTGSSQLQTQAPYTNDYIYSDFNLKSDSTMAFSSRDLTNNIRTTYILDSTFSIIDSVFCSSFENDAHDIIMLDNGGRLMICEELRPMDLSAFTTTTGVPGSATGEIYGNIIQEFDANNNLIFEWKTIDNFFASETDMSYFTMDDFFDHAHVNSIDLDTDGHFLMSSRHLNQVTKIHRTTGQIIWRFGGPLSDFTLLNDTIPFNGQHDTRRLSNDRLIVFDNATNAAVKTARILEYTLDETNMTASLDWSYEESNGLESRFMGSAQLLPNDNRFIGWGAIFPLETNSDFQELDVNGNITMNALFDGPYASYRAKKHVLPFQIHRPVISCDQTNTTLSGPSGYNHYLWSNGDTTQTITVTALGEYNLWVEQGIGYVKSQTFTVSDLSNICSNVGVNSEIVSTFKVFPNPAQDYIQIVFEGNTPNEINVYDLSGRIVIAQFSVNENDRMDISNLKQGVYIIQSQTHSTKFIKQ